MSWTAARGGARPRRGAARGGGGQQPQPVLVALHRLRGAMDHVVHGRTRGLAAARDLGERPVAPQGELQHLALLLGEEGRVAFEELDLALSRFEAAKGHALTEDTSTVPHAVRTFGVDVLERPVAAWVVH